MIVKEINLTSIERQDPNSERQRLIDRPETRRTGDRDSVMTVMGGRGGAAGPPAETGPYRGWFAVPWARCRERAVERGPEATIRVPCVWGGECFPARADGCAGVCVRFHWNPRSA